MTRDEVAKAIHYVEGMNAPPSVKRRTLLKVGIRTDYQPHEGQKQRDKAKKFAKA